MLRPPNWEPATLGGVWKGRRPRLEVERNDSPLSLGGETGLAGAEEGFQEADRVALEGG